MSGEAWQVHGGGFYHMQKYTLAPAELPDELTWFKWESYSTWLSGAAMLILVYYLGANLFLIDPEKVDLPVWGAIAISIGGLALGWIVYDALCKSPLKNNDTALLAVLFVYVVAASWGFDQVFSGRGAMLHTGAMIATLMTANVFFIIIPNQTIVVSDLKAGRTPEARLGKEAKQRSLHNNYLTLPVVFLMLSNHYPLAFATDMELGDRRAGAADRRGRPAFLQYDACDRTAALVVLGRRRRPLRARHHAVRRAWLAGGSRAGRSGGARVEGRSSGGARRLALFRGGAVDRRLPLLHVPCQGAALAGHDPCAEECAARDR